MPMERSSAREPRDCPQTHRGKPRSRDRRRHTTSQDQPEPLSLESDARVRREFVGSKITSDAGLLADGEVDQRLALPEKADRFLAEQRTEWNIRHHWRR